MTTTDLDRFQNAHKWLLRSLRNRMVSREDLGSEERATLIARYKTELEELHQEKQGAMQRFDEEIRHYEELIKGLQKGSGKEKQTHQSPQKKRPSRKKSPKNTPSN